MMLSCIHIGQNSSLYFLSMTNFITKVMNKIPLANYQLMYTKIPKLSIQTIPPAMIDQYLITNKISDYN